MLRTSVRSRLHGGWIFGALLIASVAAAQPSLERTPTLGAKSSHAQQVRLACEKRRCLSLRVAQRWLTAARVLAAGTVVPANVASLAAAGTGQASPLLAAPAVPPLGVGAHIALRDGRALDLQLTPTPTRCAPLLSLRY